MIKDSIYYNDRKYSNSGFTLVETLVAFSIFVLMALAFLPVFSFITKANFQNKERLIASSLASSIMEEIRALDYDDVGTDGGNPNGLIPAQQKKTVDGVEYFIDSYIEWANATKNNNIISEFAYKKVRVTVSAVNAFTGKLTKLDEIDSIVSRESEEPLYEAGGISVIIKNVKNEIYIGEKFSINISNEPDTSTPYNNYNIITEEGKVYFGIIPEGSYRVKVKVPRGIMAMHGEVIEDGWIIRKNVNVVDWQTTQVVIYMDIEENLCDMNLNMINAKTDEIINEGGLISLIWNIDGESIKILDKKVFSSSDLKNIVTDNFTHFNSLQSDFFGKLSPLGDYKIVIENVPDYRDFDTSLGGVVNYTSDTDGYLPWGGAFGETGQEIYVSACLKPLYYFVTYDEIELEHDDSNIIDNADLSFYNENPPGNLSGNAFDKDIDTAWTISKSNNNNKEESVYIDVGENGIKIKKLGITLSADYKFHFLLYGSDYRNFDREEKIFNQENIEPKNGKSYVELVLNDPLKSYRYYKIEIKLTQENKNSIVNIFEFSLYKDMQNFRQEFINGPLSLDRYSPAPNFTINWDAIIPEKASYEIYTGITVSPDVQPLSWSEVVSNGQKIPNINFGDNLVGKYLWIKEVLISNSSSVTPRRNWLKIYYDE